MLDLDKIEQIAKAVDEHLRKLEGMTGLLREIKASLDEIRHAQERAYRYELDRLRVTVADLADQLGKRGLPQSDRYEKEFREVRAAVDGPAWPQAVDPAVICDTAEKAALRADSILDILVGEHLKGKRLLDYGCGHGHVVLSARAREVGRAVGYDVDLSRCVAPGPDFTDDFAAVKRAAPFDIVVLHDVLDHAVLIDPLQILLQVKSVLAPKGRVYVRNHPWSARHGGHLYEKKNKAFLHLALDAVELARAGGYQCEPNVRVVTPLETYRHWFAETGFAVLSEIPVKSPVEEFFLRPSPVHDRIRKHFESAAAMANHLEVAFVEYVLEPAGLSQQVL